MKKIEKFLLWFIVLFAATINLLPYFVDGQTGSVKNNCGFIFGSNFRDGLWFLSVANVSFQKFPFIHPTFSGEILKGYHFVPNFFVYLLSKIGISSFFSYFKIIPVVYFFLISFIIIKLIKKISKNSVVIFISLFFFYFGMPLTLLTSIINKQPLNNGLLINTFQATRILESPHTAFSLIIILLIYHWLKNGSWQKNWLWIIILYFLNFGIKFYGAVTLTLILGFYLLLNLKNNFKNNLIKIIQLFIIGVLAIVVFLKPDLKQSSTFSFSPFATVHHLIESENLFYNKNLVLARYFLYEKGFGPRLLLIEIYSLILFVIFYIGARVFGTFYLIGKLIKKKIELPEFSLLISFFVLVFLSAFFVQRGDWFNPIQFLVPISYILSIYTGLFFYKIFNKNKVLFTIFFLPVFIFTFIPNLLNFCYPFSSSRFIIAKEEISALNFLRKQPFGTVFSPIDENDTSYVSTFSFKPTYLNFLTINQTLGTDYQKRLKQVENPETFNPEKIEAKYFYLPKESPYSKKIVLKFSPKKYKKIFENEKVIIFSCF